jgi:hypothetical protein
MNTPEAGAHPPAHAATASQPPESTHSHMPLARLVYASVAPAPASSRDLMDILEVARFRNRKAGITGLLCYANQRFLQVLEGPPEAVCETFYRLLRDSRHSEIRLLDFRHTAGRLFDDWTMGFAGVGEITNEIVARHSPSGDFSGFGTAPEAALAFVADLAPLLSSGDLAPTA